MARPIEDEFGDFQQASRRADHPRFGFEDGNPRTLAEVCQTFAVTRERIRQIEAEALRKLRHPSRSSLVRAFYQDSF